MLSWPINQSMYQLEYLSRKTQNGSYGMLPIKYFFIIWLWAIPINWYLVLFGHASLQHYFRELLQKYILLLSDSFSPLDLVFTAQSCFLNTLFILIIFIFVNFFQSSNTSIRNTLLFYTGVLNFYTGVLLYLIELNEWKLWHLMSKIIFKLW